MHTEWIARLDMKEMVVLRANEATTIEEHFAVPGPVAAAQVDRWFPGWHRDNGSSRAKLLDFCDALDVAPGASAVHIETRWLKERVQSALRRQELLVVPALRQGAFGPLLQLITQNVVELPKTRGLYIVYRFDIPFYIGHARANIRACLEIHLPRKRRAFAKVPERIVQFDYQCPRIEQETVADVLRELDPATFGDIGLEPDPVEPPAKCRHRDCQCLAYDDRNSRGSPKIRFVAAMKAVCACGHNYVEHD